MKKIVLATSALMLIGKLGFSQNPGELDANFGISGYALSDPYNNTSEAYFDMIKLHDNKIMMVGYSDDFNNKDILIARFLENGTPDSSFSLDGFLEVDMSIGGNEEARSVYELPNGEVLVTGYVQTMSSHDGFILKVKDDGTVDNGFGYEGGHSKFNAGDFMICEGKGIAYDGTEIYVGATFLNSAQLDLMLINFNSDGTIDSSFSTNGMSSLDVDGGNDAMNVLKRTSNGAFIFAGYADSSGTQLGYVASFSQFGTPTTFGEGGIYKFDDGAGENFVNDLILDDNNNIILVGGDGVHPNVNGFIRKLTSAGEVDALFASNGSMVSDPGATTALYFTGIVESPDGNMIATGHFEGASDDLYAMAVEPDGTLYSDFGTNGDNIIPMSISTNTLYTTGSAVQDNGDVVFGGYLTSQDFVGANQFMVRLTSTIVGASVGETPEIVLNVFPNPTTESFKIEGSEVKNVQLIALDGSVVANWSNEYNYNLPEHITDGTYILKMETESGVSTAKLIVR